MARKGAFDPSLIITRASPLTRDKAGSALPKGAAGALAQGLRAAVRDGLRDIAPEQIEDQGFSDRLGEMEEDDAALRDSFARHGQLVPVLLRPSAEAPERYEVIYGRRRVRAAKALGLPVKAIIRALEGEAAVVAQGQENTARRDLSFIEKARFARLITEEGYSREVAIQALNCHDTILSVMLSVMRDIPDEIILAIGPAPGIGRDRWFDLAKATRTKEDRLSAARDLLGRPDIAPLTSDERFLAVAALLAGEGPAAKPGGSGPAQPVAAKARRPLLDATSRSELGSLRRDDRWITIRIAASPKHAGFADWLDAQAEQLIADLHARYLGESREE